MRGKSCNQYYLAEVLIIGAEIMCHQVPDAARFEDGPPGPRQETKLATMSTSSHFNKRPKKTSSRISLQRKKLVLLTCCTYFQAQKMPQQESFRQKSHYRNTQTLIKSNMHRRWSC